MKRDRPRREVPALQLESLLALAKLGDSDAFLAIYDGFVDRIYRFVSSMVQLKEDAEEITQDTFANAYMNLKFLREDSHFENWLYRIARNEVYKRRRREKVKPSSLDDEEKGIIELLRSKDLAADPEGQLLSDELGGVVRAALESLPLKYREVLVLATIEERNYKEISEIVGRSVSAVKTDVYRARIMLRRRMKKYLRS